MNIEEFNKIVKGTIIKKPKVFKNRISIDTRTIKRNDIFIPIKFKDKDGCIYIKEASKYASLVLIPKYYLETTNILEEILNNLENINAQLIEMKIPQNERLIRLNNIAKKQIELLRNNRSFNDLKNKLID